jgi:ParB family chromosome partitioning protein
MSGEEKPPPNLPAPPSIEQTNGSRGPDPAATKAAPPLPRELIPVEEVFVPEDHRAINPEGLELIIGSMRNVGDLGVIQVVRSHARPGKTAKLISGGHRLEAAKQLGYPKIAAVFVDHLSEHDRRRWEIYENYARAEFTAAERAVAMADLRRIDEEERAASETATTCGSSGGRGKKGFITETAERTDRSREDVRRDVARAGGIPQIKDVIGTSLDSGVKLDELRKRSHEEQAEIIERARAGEQVSARTPDETEPEPESEPAPVEPEPESEEWWWETSPHAARQSKLVNDGLHVCRFLLYYLVIPNIIKDDEASKVYGSLIKPKYHNLSELRLAVTRRVKDHVSRPAARRRLNRLLEPVVVDDPTSIMKVLALGLGGGTPEPDDEDPEAAVIRRFETLSEAQREQIFHKLFEALPAAAQNCILGKR